MFRVLAFCFLLAHVGFGYFVSAFALTLDCLPVLHFSVSAFVSAFVTSCVLLFMHIYVLRCLVLFALVCFGCLIVVCFVCLRVVLLVWFCLFDACGAF